MTLIVIANIVFIAFVVLAIVGMLSGAIFTSRTPEARVATARVRRERPAPARARAYRTYEGLKA